MAGTAPSAGGNSLVDDDEIVPAKRNDVAGHGVLDVGRVGFDVRRHQLLRRLDPHGGDPGQVRGEEPGVHEAEEVEVESVAGRVHGQDVLPDVGILGQRRLEQDEAAAGRSVGPLLPELDAGLPGAVGELAVALGTLPPALDQLHEAALLDGDAGAPDGGRPDGQPDLEPAGMRLGPHPTGIDEMEGGDARGHHVLLAAALLAALLQGRDALQAEAEQLGRLGLEVLPPSAVVGHLIPAAPAALIHVDRVGPTRSSVQDGGEVELRGQTCRALIRRVRHDEGPTQAARDLHGSGGLASGCHWCCWFSSGKIRSRNFLCDARSLAHGSMAGVVPWCPWSGSVGRPANRANEPAAPRQDAHKLRSFFKS